MARRGPTCLSFLAHSVLRSDDAAGTFKGLTWTNRDRSKDRSRSFGLMVQSGLNTEVRIDFGHAAGDAWTWRFS